MLPGLGEFAFAHLVHAKICLEPVQRRVARQTVGLQPLVPRPRVRDVDVRPASPPVPLGLGDIKQPLEGRGLLRFPLGVFQRIQRRRRRLPKAIEDVAVAAFAFVKLVVALRRGRRGAAIRRG